MSTETARSQSVSRWEPIVMYLSRMTAAAPRIEGGIQKAQQRVLNHIDQNPTQTFNVMRGYLQKQPYRSDMYAAELVVRHLAQHPELTIEQRQMVAGDFNSLLDTYKLTPGGKRTVETIAQVVPLCVELDLSAVDTLVPTLHTVDDLV